MRKKSLANAISLFSFQDIITSITGIMFMIVIFLVILIFDAPLNDSELDNSKLEELEQYQKLQEQLALRQEDLTQLRSKFKQLNTISLDQIEKKHKDISSQIEELIKRNITLNSEVNKLDQELVEINFATVTEEQKFTQLTELIKSDKDKIAKDSIRIKKLQAIAEERKNLIEFTINDNFSKNPIVIIANKNDFKTKDFATNELRIFSKNSLYTNEFTNYLNEKIDANNYIYILIKPSSFVQSIDLLDYLFNLKADFGYDILSNEDATIFNEEEYKDAKI